MKYYIVEYTGWTGGSRDFGYPYRTHKVINDRMEALGFIKDRVTAKNVYIGYLDPVLLELELIGEINTHEAIKELDRLERENDMGMGI